MLSVFLLIPLKWHSFFRITPLSSHFIFIKMMSSGISKTYNCWILYTDDRSGRTYGAMTSTVRSNEYITVSKSKSTLVTQKYTNNFITGSVFCIVRKHNTEDFLLLFSFANKVCSCFILNANFSFCQQNSQLQFLYYLNRY